MTTWVTWSPDGSQVAFVKDGPAESVVDPDLYVMNTDGPGLPDSSNRHDTYESSRGW